MPFLFQVVQLDLQVAPEQLHHVLRIGLQHLRYAQVDGLTVPDDHTVGGETHFAIGEGIQGRLGFLQVHAPLEVHHHLDMGGGVVLDVGQLDLSSLARPDDRVNQRLRRGAERDLADDQTLARSLLDDRPHPDTGAGTTVLVIADVHEAARGKIGIELEGFSPQVSLLCFQQLHKVVGQNAGGQADGDALGPQREKQWKPDRQRHRLTVPAVVGQLVAGKLGGKEYLFGKRCQSGLDVTRGGRRITGDRISPVALGVDEQSLLPQRHQGGVDGSVTVRMVFHAVAHQVGHLVVAAVLVLPQRIQDTPLYGLKSVLQLGDGPVGNDVRRVLQKIVSKRLLDPEAESGGRFPVLGVGVLGRSPGFLHGFTPPRDL